MLISLKSKAPGAKVFAAALCACGCDVYMSLRPQFCIKAFDCIAASGEDASIMVCGLCGVGEVGGKDTSGVQGSFVQPVKPVRRQFAAGIVVDMDNC